MTEYSIETLAYTAGFIDGEGCIAINKVLPTRYISHSYSLSVSVSSTDEASVKWLHSTFGGYAKSRVGQPSMTKPEWRPAWEWSIHANHAQQFLKRILPYLKIKHHQANVAIEFQAYNVSYSMRVFQDPTIKQEIVERKEIYRQHINSFHGTKREWTRSEEFTINDIPQVNNPIAILSYTAGLIDGEGCISISVRLPTEERGKGKLSAPSHCLRVKIANTDFFIIDWLLSTFGGSTSNSNGKAALSQGNKPARDWLLSGENAKAFLEKTVPYLRIKQKQAELAIEFQTYHNSHSRHIIANQTKEVTDQKEEYRQRLNSMNMIRKPVKSIYA